MQFTVTENAPLNRGVYRMTLAGDTRAFTRPGQFAQVRVPGFYLRRPLSACDWEPAVNGRLTLVYKTVGQGTEALSRLPAGTALDLLTGLGNGFDTGQTEGPRLSRAPLLLGGGVGTPPLYGLCRRLLGQGKKPLVALGFNCEGDILLQKEFEALGAPTLVATADGSACMRGFATDAAETLAGRFDYLYACGPEPMLRAAYDLCERLGVDGQFSFEARMACGFGACLGCSVMTVNGSRRVCREGPVFFRKEIVWPTRE
jgi:dihydroorotate dehydrogenase electron transfer subunit